MAGRGWFIQERQAPPEVLAKEMEFVFAWNLWDEVSLSEEQWLICQFSSTYNRNTTKVAIEKSELRLSCKKALIFSSSYLQYVCYHGIFALKISKYTTSRLPSPRLSCVLFFIPSKDCRAHSSKPDRDIPEKQSAVFGKMERQANLSAITQLGSGSLSATQRIKPIVKPKSASNRSGRNCSCVK